MRPVHVVEALGRWSVGRSPLYVSLARRIRGLIDDGELPPGTSLPSDRLLASALTVSRSTVVAAYDQLVVDGRIVRRRGSGTRVVGDETPPPRSTTEPLFLHLLGPGEGVVPLMCAAPDAPPPKLVEAYRRTVPRLAELTDDMGYHPMGHPDLRHAIAERYTARGAPTALDQVLVTNGGQQALTLVARSLLHPGDGVLVEAPTYPGALEILRHEGAALHGLPVGLAGLADAVAAHRPSLAYLISGCHNPTGATLPAPLRRHVARAARERGLTLVDDEVLAELGFPGEEMPPPLAAFDADVITVGSLSKVAWGGLRVGWVRAPAAVIARLSRLRAVHDLGGDVASQLAAADLLGDLDAVARRGAVRRQDRHDHLRDELARQLPDWEAPSVRGGQTLWVRLPRGDGVSFAQTALRHGVAVLAGAGLDTTGGSADRLRVPFLASPEILSEGVRRLTAAWGDYSRFAPERRPLR